MQGAKVPGSSEHEHFGDKITVGTQREETCNTNYEFYERFATRTGMLTRKLDHALPGMHTKRLYNRLSRGQAAVLS